VLGTLVNVKPSESMEALADFFPGPSGPRPAWSPNDKTQSEMHRTVLSNFCRWEGDSILKAPVGTVTWSQYAHAEGHSRGEY